MKKLFKDIYFFLQCVYQVIFVDAKQRYEIEQEIEKSIIEKYSSKGTEK